MILNHFLFISIHLGKKKENKKANKKPSAYFVVSWYHLL